MKHVSVHQALQNVADGKITPGDEVVNHPVSELVAKSLFVISNTPDSNVRGSYARANKARKMILDRLVGKRRPGSHPATREPVVIEFVDLTAAPEIGGDSGEDGTTE